MVGEDNGVLIFSSLHVLLIFLCIRKSAHKPAGLKIIFTNVVIIVSVVEVVYATELLTPAVMQATDVCLGSNELYFLSGSSAGKMGMRELA